MIQTKYFYAVIIIICSTLSTIMEHVRIDESASRVKKSGTESIWCECDLTAEEWPDYYFFTNAQHAHYNLTLESAVAYVVKDYALDFLSEITFGVFRGLWNSIYFNKIILDTSSLPSCGCRLDVKRIYLIKKHFLLLQAIIERKISMSIRWIPIRFIWISLSL